MNFMEIELKQIPIRDVTDGYVDSAENGVVGYGGKLDIRPAFQREFVYKEKQRDAGEGDGAHFPRGRLQLALGAGKPPGGADAARGGLPRRGALL